MRSLILLFILFLGCRSTHSQVSIVTFKLSNKDLKSGAKITIRGNVAPLSWEADYLLNDEDGDGTYEATIQFNTSRKLVNYKFLFDGYYELEGNNNRMIELKDSPQVKDHIINEFNYYDEDQISKLRYTKEEIQEDLDVLKRALTSIHPNLYKYITKSDLDADFQTLRKEILLDPTQKNVYKYVSKFASNIKCSHTFTNPWNQVNDIEYGIYHQPDKVPFTFIRTENRLFIDKNASDDPRLQEGLEIISINGIKTNQILKQLLTYITSDGDNYDKRLERLTMNGDEKYALFDIFYALEFGSSDIFSVELKDHQNNTSFVTDVSSMSKTKRSKILNERYDSLAQKFEDGWQFQLLDDRVALLEIRSFAVFNKGFDWKEFLDNVFIQLNKNKIEHFIIDIRRNEGGDDLVGEYILKRIIQKQVKVDGLDLFTSYRKIPEDIRPYINTWSKAPYNWSYKVKKKDERRYQFRSIFAYKGKVYSPQQDGYRGKTYLLTGAQNSSATHTMATYVKQHNLATIIGQKTGGNQRGMNGGFMFFLKLPNCRVELDIPVIESRTQNWSEELPNGGIVPDVVVKKRIDQIINGVDAELEATLKIIRGNIY